MPQKGFYVSKIDGEIFSRIKGKSYKEDCALTLDDLLSHTRKISKHGLGLAVDINTLYNPYIKEVDGKRILEPATAENYVDCSKNFPYKIDKDDLYYNLFAAHGFEWGGNWRTEKIISILKVPDAVVKILYPQK